MTARVAPADGTTMHGLSDTEARARLHRDGPNELPTAPPPARWRRFAAQFGSVLVILLLVAAAISAVLWVVERDTLLPYDALAILAIVLLNASLGYAQELRAESAVAALRALSAPEATVVRDGDRRRVAARELVVGDLLLVEAGDSIPADARIAEAVALQVTEAALTGESVPVSKSIVPVADDAPIADRTDMLFSGTTVVNGHGRAVVRATGARTELGRVAGLLDAVSAERTPLQDQLDHTGRVLGVGVVCIAAVVIATIFIVDEVRGLAAAVDVLLLGVALAVAAVPEGLPAIVTAVLAIGVRRMARRNAIVRHLAAVETLGSATVIASDKTGTLTSNRMTVRVAVTASGRASFDERGELALDALAPPQRVELEQALTAGRLANNAALQWREGELCTQGDPTESALLLAARNAGLDIAALDARWPRVHEHPFSSERKLMSTVHASDDDPSARVLFVKGAPDMVLVRCSREVVGTNLVPLTDERRDAIRRLNEQLAGDALRTLAMARRELGADDVIPESDAIERELVFLGLVGMIDPPRPEAGDAVRRARDAGIRTMLVTGDHPRTASIIARELGIAQDDRVVAGPEIARMSDEALAAAVREIAVFARVDPAHKLRIVRALQANGEVVAMTGDGVNDAPALKAADIGVAMGRSGTDVSREAADMVLADDNFATIVAAVEEGRAIYANIRRCLQFLLSGNFGEVLTMFLAVALATRIGLREPDGRLLLPLLATQILWINLLSDGAPALALGVDPAERGLMRARPRGRSERVVSPRMWLEIGVLGVVIALASLYVLDAALPGGFVDGTGDAARARTMTFTTIVLAQLFNVFAARAHRRSAFTDLAATHWIWGAVLVSLLLQVAVVHLAPLQTVFRTAPLSAMDWLVCTAMASAVLWASELLKLADRRWRSGRRGPPPPDR
jgi:Ca2+-transporting ATPase